jgi:hypothetical protein
VRQNPGHTRRHGRGLARVIHPEPVGIFVSAEQGTLFASHSSYAILE